MFKLALPFPPSVNHYWRHVGNRVLVSKKGREYRGIVGSLVHRKNIKTLEGDLVVDIKLTPPDRRRRDVDNSLKALLDSMQFGGLYFDDSQIVRLSVEKLRPDPDQPRADVTIHYMPAEVSEAALRTCLRCDTTFASEGPGNRICQTCAALNQELSPLAEPVWSGKRRNGHAL